uniref:Reverse transcriptase domain-containing protein n=1 Tax=Tanacetum cinerariifolium TaxID=118510 RepID=A0A6L2P6T6_TANCI|nr:reverse transcriptase domain-containing protein [Tanacetum cinerariifolium]
MTLELANRAICTPDGIARDVFVPVGKFTFPADFVVFDYKSDPRVPLILGRPFLRTTRALIDVYGEEMILRDGDERLTLNIKHDTTSYSNHPHRESINLINIFNVSSEDCLEVSISNQTSGNPTFSHHQELTSPEVTHEIHDSEGCNDIHPYFDDNPLSGSTTYSSNSLLEEFTDELALITYPSDYDDNLQDDALPLTNNEDKATESDEFIKFSVENLNPIPNQFEDFSESNDEFSSTDDDSFSIDNIDYVEASPPDSELVSSEVMEIVIPEISSGSTTTHSDISLTEYKGFYDDHVKEISSGCTITHSDSPLYDSFIFVLSINPFPPANRSDFYEFADELIHFISPSEYDCFLFKTEPNSKDFTMDVVEDISPTKEPRVQNAFPTLQLNLKVQSFSESLFTYVVWIFLPFLVYSVAPQYLLSLRNEDTIFDPGISIIILFRPDVSHWCGIFP